MIKKVTEDAQLAVVTKETQRGRYVRVRALELFHIPSDDHLSHTGYFVIVQLLLEPKQVPW